MKFKLYIFLSFIIVVVAACHKTPVGFLITEYAGYEPDSLIVKSQLTDTAHTEEPNPLYDEYLGYGFTPEELAQYFEIYPTTIVAGEDYFRYKYDVPWVTTQIQGLDGTNPIQITVKNVTTNTGDAEKMKEYLSIRGDGTMTLPAKTDISPGKYIISLTFQNEGYTKSRDDIFTIIVE